MAINKVFWLSCLAGVAAAASNAAQASDVSGVWLDNTGRGAVRISDCGGGLCGRIVWLKDAGQAKVCGLQVIGGVKPVAGGTWDGGWIYDPDERARYAVELTPMPDGRLKVLGYMGTKMLSETMIWTRAPSDIKPCA